MDQDRIVAVGFLTERDLQMLGEGFTRALPVQKDDLFNDLLAKLDDFEATPLADSVVLHRKHAVR